MLILTIFLSQDFHQEAKETRNTLLGVILQARSRPLTVLESFTYYTGILYTVLGILCILVPDYISRLFLIKITSQTTSYGRLAGNYLVGIGVVYVTSALSSPRRVPVNRIIIGTVFERIIFVNLSCLLIYFNHSGPLGLVASVMAMDTILATISYVLWTRETNAGTLVSIPWTFKKVLQLCSLRNITTVHKSSSVVKLLGYTQVFVGTAFLVRPDVVEKGLDLDPFDEHSKGILSFAFMCFAVIGWLHILAGSGDACLFNIMAVFYRVFFSIPFNYYLSNSNQIAPNLSKCFICFDAVAAHFIGVLLFIEGYI